MATKNKTNKSVKKRIKVTGTGKLKHAKVGRRHLNAHMTGKRKRHFVPPELSETGRRCRRNTNLLSESVDQSVE
jgi:large subunit ribosomal protein L35